MRRNVSDEKPKTDAKQKALDLLLYRTRTAKELYDKLVQRGYPPEEAAEAVDYAGSFGYVNDEDYARRYVSAHSKSEGRYAIKRQLTEKGLAEELIEAAMEELPEEEDILPELLQRKYGGPHQLDEREYRKIYGYLIRHGFSQSGIRKALRNYGTEE